MTSFKWWVIFCGVLAICGTVIASVAIATDAATFEQIATTGGKLVGAIILGTVLVAFFT